MVSWILDEYWWVCRVGVEVDSDEFEDCLMESVLMFNSESVLIIGLDDFLVFVCGLF